MCRWYCTSEGGSTNLRCLHCGAGYCGACLHGDGGKMESLVKCSKCGKKPRTKEAGTRGAWKAGGDAPITAPASSSTGVVAGTRSVGGTSDADTVAKFASNLRPESTAARSAGAAIIGSTPAATSPNKPKGERKLAGFGVRLTEGQLQEKLASIFESYLKMAPTATAMDNVKWKKCLSDLGLIDRGPLNSTEIDMIFTKVKQKGERRLNFTGFYDAFTLCAQKKFPDAENDQAALSQLLAVAGVAGEMDGGAAASAAVAAAEEKKVTEAPPSPQPVSPNPSAAKKPPKSPNGGGGGSSIFDRLTDTTKYTGAHKARFGADGKGLGKGGRDDMTTTDDLSKIVRGGGMSGSMAPSGPVVPTREVSPERKLSASPAKKKAAAPSSGGGNIFDRLTDTSKYTGAHKQRFGADGKGRGLAGRDGGINQNPTASLANLTRRA